MAPKISEAQQPTLPIKGVEAPASAPKPATVEATQHERNDGSGKADVRLGGKFAGTIELPSTDE
jgi:hypothetical protein